MQIEVVTMLMVHSPNIYSTTLTVPKILATPVFFCSLLSSDLSVGILVFNLFLLFFLRGGGMYTNVPEFAAHVVVSGWTKNPSSSSLSAKRPTSPEIFLRQSALLASLQPSILTNAFVFRVALQDLWQYILLRALNPVPWKLRSDRQWVS